VYLSSSTLLHVDGSLLLLPQLPVADGAVLGRDLGVRVLWELAQEQQSQGQEQNSDVQVIAVGTRLWKEDAGVIPPRTAQTTVAAKAGNMVSNTFLVAMQVQCVTVIAAACLCALLSAMWHEYRVLSSQR
jgi:hypothetical protein